MDVVMWALVIGWAALGLALLSACITVYAIFKPPRDQDVEELGDEVARLTRRARADTMRRVRQEAKSPEADGVAPVDVPPELKTHLQAAHIARDPRAVKQALRQRVFGGNGGAS